MEPAQLFEIDIRSISLKVRRSSDWILLEGHSISTGWKRSSSDRIGESNKRLPATVHSAAQSQLPDARTVNAVEYSVLFALGSFLDEDVRIPHRIVFAKWH